jgi:hypothetical protein
MTIANKAKIRYPRKKTLIRYFNIELKRTKLTSHTDTKWSLILKVVEMTLLKYPTWEESFPKTIHMLTMIMNEQQTMPYYLSDEIASKPYNPN